MKHKNLILLGVAAVIAVVPLLLPAGGAFRGSDDQGTEAIAALAPGYQPWISPLWTPPSGEVESLLFALQAGLGAGLMGYYVGFRRGRQSRGADAGRDGG